MSGDDNEPASVWKSPLEELGVTFVNVDETIGFERCKLVSEKGAEAIRNAAAGRPIVGAVYDYFALPSGSPWRRVDWE